MQYFDSRMAGLDPSTPGVAAQLESVLGQLDVTIVGLGRSAWDTRTTQPSELVLTTPTFAAQARPVAQYSINAVDLEPGKTTQQVIDEATADARGTFGAMKQRSVLERGYHESVRPDVVSLLVFALVTAVMSVIVLANAFGREAYATQVDGTVRRALGMTRAQSAATTLLRILLMVVAGVGASVPLAIAVSGRVLRGPVRVTDPDQGIRVEPLPLVACVIAFALALVTLSLPAVLRVAKNRAGRETKRSHLASRVAALGAPVPIVVGARNAFERGAGRTAVPVRTATWVAIAAAIVATGAGVFAVSLDRLVSNPAAYGVTWGLTTSANFDKNRDCSDEARSCDGEPILDERANAIEAFLHDDPAVSSWTAATTATISVSGSPIAIVGLGPGTVRPPMLSGSEPGDGEIVLRPADMREQHLHVGDRITTDKGGSVRIAGAVLAPIDASDDNGLGHGGLMTYATASRLAEKRINTGFLVAVRDADAIPTTIDRFNARFAGQSEAFGIRRPTVPITIVDYGRIHATPKAIAKVLSFLALLTLLMATVSSLERRLRDFAVLRSLGVTSAQTAGAVVAQAVIATVTVIVVSVPIGLIAGRSIWSALERHLGTREGAAWPMAPLTVAITVTSLAMLASLIRPCVRAIDRPPGEVLRAE